MSEPSKSKIQFIHVPKCGGNSLYRTMGNALGLKKRNELPVGPTIHAARQVKWGLGWQAFEEHYLQCRAFLLQTFMHEGYELIGGHFPYSPAAKQWFGHEFSFVTVLREPVSRLISNLIWLTLVSGREPLDKFKSGEASVEAELEWMLSNELAVWVARTYCLYFGGLNGDMQGHWEGSRDRAVDHLENLDLIGFTEDMPGFARRFEERFGAALPVVLKNETREVLGEKLHERAKAFFTPERRRVCEAMSADDRVVYEAALRLVNG